MANNDSLILFSEIESVTRKLNNEQFGELIRAVIAYRFRKEVYTGDDVRVDMCFEFLSNQVDREEAVRVRRAKAAESRWDGENGKEGNSPDDGMQANAEECKPMQSDASECKPMQSDASECKPMQSDASECKPMQSDANDAPIPSHPIQSHPIQSRPFRSHPIRSHPFQSRRE